MADRQERCETCRWWRYSVEQEIDAEDGNEDGRGECRRYPPRTSDAMLLLMSLDSGLRDGSSSTFANADGQTSWEGAMRNAAYYACNTIFPTVTRLDLCGEWTPKAAP